MAKGSGGLAKAQAARQHAYAVIRQMEKPPGLTEHQWGKLLQFLYIVARSYPKAYKSQATMAAEMHVSERSIKRYVQWGRDSGLLEVWPDAGQKSRRNLSKTNRYVIVSLEPELTEHGDKMSPSGGAKMALKGYSGTFVPPYQDTALSEGEQALPTRESASRPQAGTTTEDGETTVGWKEVVDEANALGRINRPVRKSRPARDPDPARRLVSHFCERWCRMVEDRPKFKDIRPAHTRSATGYMRDTFLSPKDGPSRSEADVEAIINRFVEAVYRGKIRIKPTQTAFQCFTGSWHRTVATKAPVGDRYEKYRTRT